MRASLPPSLVASLEESFGYSLDPLQISEGVAPTPLAAVRQKLWASRAAEERIASLSQPQPPQFAAQPEGGGEPHALNERAVRVIRRVDNKLTGREFGEQLTVAEQVQRLIEQATSNQNLCQCYTGWCPWW